MVTESQVRRLMREMEQGKGMAVAAVKAGMSERTARKYLKENRLPNEIKAAHSWRTRTDPFEEVWMR